ncbi:MarR family winged helix-turn-helix transcriptional regulator [Saccharopolyspora endophytica]|uniref:MarR family transcriptional regulator n=1 Tax=Saccharopolyspora endophytica TaxID=543886 RepID=A0ABS5DGP5_9PSEU|nr:MarR family transcriptional regulator [Saccharopolyspora endophytica]MBQ0925458.1 MarR family transcriptional regulator [Saccharopolyspora endophytica]
MSEAPEQEASTRYKVAVWRSLMEVHQSVLQEIEQDLASAHALSSTEFDTLINIPAQGIRFNDLRDQVILSQSALSRLVTRLEQRGLVQRSSSVNDLRGVEVELTAEGKNLRRKAARTNAAAAKRAFADHLTKGELDTLYDIFSRLEKAAKDS